MKRLLEPASNRAGLRAAWKVRALILGSLVSNGGALLVGVLFLVIATASLTAAGASPDHVTDRVMMSLGTLAVLTSIGTGFTVLGGYVAGRISRAKEIQHALASGIPCVLLGLVMGRGSVPVGFWVLS